MRSQIRPNRLRRQGRGERGAGIVEYAFVIALVAVPTVPAVDYLAENLGEAYEVPMAELVGDFDGDGDPNGGGGGSTTTTAPTSTTSTTTTQPRPTSTTTPPNSTTSSTTTSTTTTSTTTTTTPATTTTQVSSSVGASIGKTSTRRHPGKTWSATTEITISDPGGNVVNGATVTVTVSYKTVGRKGRESWSSETVTVGTDSAGGAEVTSDRVKRGGKSKVEQIRFSIDSVEHPQYDWDGQAASVMADSP